MRLSAIAATLAIVAHGNALATTLIPTASGTSTWGASIGQAWIDTILNAFLSFMFGWGLMFIGGLCIFAGVQRMRAAQEKGEWLGTATLTLLTVGLCAGGGGIYGFMAQKAASSATGFLLAQQLHHLAR